MLLSSTSYGETLLKSVVNTKMTHVDDTRYFTFIKFKNNEIGLTKEEAESLLRTIPSHLRKRENNKEINQPKTVNVIFEKRYDKTLKKPIIEFAGTIYNFE